jgi:hypothetical protein
MRISFTSDSDEGSSVTNFRKIEDSQFPLVYQGLLWASTPEEYRIYARKLRSLVVKAAEPDFACVHPEWFSEDLSDELELKIDATVCHFCAYNGQCEKSKADFFVDIVFLQRTGKSSSWRSEVSVLRKAFGFFQAGSGRKYSDPFSGQSRRSNESRTLYAVSYHDMAATLCDVKQHEHLAPCIGYDLKTQQPLWSLDILLLGLIKSINKDADFSQNLMALTPNVPFSPMVSDSLFISEVFSRRGQDFNEEKKRALHRELDRLTTCLMEHAEFVTLHRMPFAPLVDFPFTRGSPRGLHLALRLLELEPSLSTGEAFMEQFPFLSRWVRQTASVRSRPGGWTSLTDANRWLPRFPAVLFTSPSHGNVRLDLPGCKIIDVVEVEVAQPFLLFDALDYDLSHVQGWGDD